MTTSHFIDIPQGFFHYHTIGTTGQQVFFCHGNSMSAGTYLPFLEEFSQKGFQIFAPDIRGHGFSTKEKTHTIKNWDIFLTDLQALVQTITTPPVIGMGHSMGGFFIYAAAALYPHLFSKIVLLDPIILPTGMLWAAALARLTGLGHRHSLARMALNKKSEFSSKENALTHYSGKGMFKTWQPEFVQAFVDWAVEKDTADTYTLCCAPWFEAQMYTMVPLNTWRHARRIHVPTLVVQGRRSEMFQSASGRKLERNITTCRFIQLENNGHFFTMENPTGVIETILPFVDQ